MEVTSWFRKPLAQGAKPFSILPTFTPAHSVPAIVAALQANHSKGTTLSLKYRKNQLRRLYDFLEENEALLVDALYRDLRKSRAESLSTEIIFVKREISEAYEDVEKWMSSKKISDLPLTSATDKAHIRHEPLGVSVIIGAWNYPVQLLLAPFVGALAAGCSAILKPSEVTKHVAAVLTTVLPNYLDADHYRVVLGETLEATTVLLDQKTDIIFYTGGSRVAKLIASQAAKNLIPCVFELGGKSPAVVMEDCSKDVSVIARRITWGRFSNAGQTCIAPDYVLVHKNLLQPLAEEIKKTIIEFYGEDAKKSEDYARMVSYAQYKRILGLMPNASYPETGTLFYGGPGSADEEELYVPPTVVMNPKLSAPVMSEEIFGPILPLIAFETLSEAVDIMRKMDKPLAMYVYGNDKDEVHHVLDQVQSGGVTLNDSLMHITVSSLPFGGVGMSGCGSYHGRKSFETFSHQRSVLERPMGMDNLVSMRYPPYSKDKVDALVWVTEKPLDGSRGLPSRRTISTMGLNCTIL